MLPLEFASFDDPFFICDGATSSTLLASSSSTVMFIGTFTSLVSLLELKNIVFYKQNNVVFISLNIKPKRRLVKPHDNSLYIKFNNAIQ